MKRFALLSLLALFVGVTLFVLITAVFDNYSIINVRVSNISSNSATISWESDIPTYGEVYYTTEETAHSAKLGQGEKAYDDRDIELNEDNEYVLKENKEKRYMHHVTLRNLDPEKEYFFSIGKNFRVEKVQEESIPNSSFKTGPVLDELETPDPLYGEIDMSNDNEQEALVYMYLTREDEAKTNTISTYLSDKNTYTFDINNLRETDLTAFDPEESLDIAIEVQIPGDKKTALSTFEFKDYQPLDTIVLEEEETNSNGLISKVKASGPQDPKVTLKGRDNYYIPQTQPSNKPQEAVKIQAAKTARNESIAKPVTKPFGPLIIGSDGWNWADHRKCYMEVKEKYTQLFGDQPIKEVDKAIFQQFLQEIRICYIRIPVCPNPATSVKQQLSHRYCEPQLDQSTPRTYAPPKLVTWDRSKNILDIKNTININKEEANKTSSQLIGNVSAQEETIQIEEDIALVEEGNYTMEIGDESVGQIAINSDDDTVVEVVFFEDKNRNGLMDEDEGQVEVNQEIELKKEAESALFQLDAGWNLISLPLISSEEINTAEKLLTHFNDQGAQIQHIAKFENGQFVMYSKRDDGTYSNDFNLIPGQGYFVFNYNPALVEIKGNSFSEPVEITLNNGWNLVGLLSNDENYDAEASIKKMNGEGFKADTLSRYEDGLYNSVVYENEVLYGNSFRIVKNQGYFVRVTEGGGYGTFSP